LGLFWGYFFSQWGLKRTQIIQAEETKRAIVLDEIDVILKQLA
jgi:hypothetical protein